MPDPGFTRPDLCSIPAADTQAEPAGAARGGLSADSHPLAGDDPDALLDLQAAFTTVYDRSGYDYSLDYRRPVEPPLSEADAAWVQERLSSLSPPSPSGQAA